MNKVKFNSLISLLVAIIFNMHLYSQDVPRFGIFELTLTASGAYSNPYLQMPDDTTAPGFVEGIFTGPNNESITIDGFWYGGQAWKIRMAPTRVGTWTYLTSSGDQGLDGISGSFSCVSSNDHGFIIKNPENPYSFAYSDSTPYFWMGDFESIFYDHSDNGITNYSYNNGTFQSLYIARAQQGFTSIYFGTRLYEKYGNFQPNEGGYNFLNSDPDSLNPLFWQAADDRVSFMCDSVGILPGIGLGWPDQGIKGFGDGRLIRALRYLIARYAAYNVMWELFGEANEYGGGWQAWVRKFGMTAKKYDPYDHLTSTHLTQTTSGTAYIGGESWSDMVIHQFDASDNLISKLTTDRQYDKAVVNVEFDWQNGYDVRRKDAWEIMTNGGWCGYGTHSVSERYQHSTPGLLYMQYLQQFFIQTHYWLLQPHNEYVISGTGYCTALPDTEYVVYLPSGGSIGLDLSGASGAFDVEWYNPRDGSTTTVPAVNAGGSVSFMTPDNNDWTLYLAKQSSDITPPSTPMEVSAIPATESRINLTWHGSNDPESGISYYRIYRDATVVGQSPDTTFSDGGLVENTTYHYEISAVNGVGLESDFSTPVSATTLADTNKVMVANLSDTTREGNLGGNVNPSVASVGEDPLSNIPSTTKLYQNFPNPFNPSTTISFYIPSTEFVILKVYDVVGREIDRLLNNKMVAGTHRVNYISNHLESGVYYYRIWAGKHSETKKMLLVK